MNVETVKVSRYRCPWCRRTFARKGYAQAHADACSSNPAMRGCRSCANFVPHPCCYMPSDHCGCKGINVCRVDAFQQWRYDNHETLEYEPKGWWRHYEDFKRDGCASWAPKDPQRIP